MTTLDSIITQIQQIQSLLQNTSELPDNLLKEIEKDLLHVSKKINSKGQKPKTNSTIHIWSDGACSGNPGPGGWGTLIHANKQYQELSGYQRQTTNNIMEMTAALEGIRQTPDGAEIVLTSDSQYLIKGMTQWLKGWKKRGWKKADGKPVLNRDLWIALDEESSLRRINWKWIKGHAGHPQNERCDELARMAIQSES